MRESNRWSLYAVDLAGGSAVAACLLGCVWLTCIDADRTRSEIAELTSLIAGARRDMKELQAALKTQRALLAGCKEKLARAGELPTRPPVEEYFQTLSRFASKRGIRVVRQNPLPPRMYPGLLEQRYTYEVSGTMSGLLALLRMIETTHYWADVGYLRIEHPVGRKGAVSDERRAALTISVFAARPLESENDRDGV